MTAPNQPTHHNTPNETTRPCDGMHRRCGGRRGGALRLVAFLVVGGLGFIAGQSFAHEGGRGGPGGFFGPMGNMDIDPAKAEARAEKMAKHLAVEADATPAQQEKLATIAKAVFKDMAGTRDRMQAHRQQMMAALSAPTVDRAKIESLRANHARDLDTISQRMTQAMADAAEVLNPEQRKKLAEHVAERQKYRRFGGGMDR